MTKLQSGNAGLYIHIPYCRAKCDYCSFVSSDNLSTQDLYVESLIKEIRQRRTDVIADTVYFGGGTPSMLKPGLLARIMVAVRKNFQVDESAEITAEANPESLSAGFIAECKDAGVNRLSIGLQSTDNKLLKGIGRIHKYQDFLRAVDLVRNAGIDNISADIILGVPGETVQSFAKTLERIASLELKHISIYALKIEESTALYKEGYRPDEDFQAELYEMACGMLSHSGYLRYEVSNFSKPGFGSRHNLKYWTMQPYLGFGVSAHSYYEGKRTENTPLLFEYTSGKFIKNISDAKADFEEEYIMLGLRMAKGISLSLYTEFTGKDFLVEKEKQVQALLALGAVEITDGFLRITDNFFYVMNEIIIRLIY